MAEQQPRLQAKITIDGPLKVGPNPQPPNRFTLSIQNLGEPIQRTPGKPPCLYLKGHLGSQAEALFFSDADARLCDKKIPADWNADWDFSRKGEGMFCLKIYTYNTTLFKKDDVLKISFSNVVSKTDPSAAATMTFETDLSTATQDLFIPKAADKPGIISFTSEPPEGVQNLPGENVTLKWLTYKLTDRELTQVGIADPLPCDFSQDAGNKTIPSVASDMTVRLRGYDGDRPVDSTLDIKVLREGWYGLRNTILKGDPGFPDPEIRVDGRELKPAETYDLEPTLLCKADNKRLYGVFRHDYQDGKRALLFETVNPFGGWSFVGSSVPGQGGLIPEGFDESPGAYFDDKIWLLGGSQIDPDNASSGVWSFDPAKGAWEDRGAAPWSPRMGHAVVVFQGKLWVMGGRDEDGNALNDVWALTMNAETNAGTWQRKGDAAWEPRCLFSPAGYDEKIWLYSGAKEPFSSFLYDDMYVYDGSAWEKKNMTGIIKGTELKTPIASCLQVFGDKLCLFGKFRITDPTDKSETVEPQAFVLTTPSTKTWSSFPSEGLKNWAGDTTFSFQVVNFGDRMLIARALEYGTQNSVLKVYVSG